MTGFKNFYFKPVYREKRKFTDEKEVREWAEAFDSRKSFTINDDLTIDSNYTFVGQSYMFAGPDNDKIIPVQFGRVEGGFQVDGCHLSSLKGCPREVTFNFSCWSNPLSSLEGCPRKARAMDFNWLFNVKTVSGIHKLIDSCKEIHIPHTASSGFLSLMMIKDLKLVKSKPVGPDVQKMQAAIDVVNHHLKGDRDVLACQEELIASGLKKFANL